MKVNSKALFPLIFLGLCISLLSCGESKKDDSKQAPVASADSLTDYSTALRAKETAYSKRQTNGYGELLTDVTRPFCLKHSAWL